MAYVETMWINSNNLTMRVKIQMTHIGEASINVPLPKELHDSILSLAGQYASLHEDQIKQAIIREGNKNDLSKLPSSDPGSDRQLQELLIHSPSAEVAGSGRVEETGDGNSRTTELPDAGSTKSRRLRRVRQGHQAELALGE